MLRSLRGPALIAFLAVLGAALPASAQSYGNRYDLDGIYQRHVQPWLQNSQSQSSGGGKRYYQQGPNQTGLQNQGGWNTGGWNNNNNWNQGYTNYNNQGWNNQGWNQGGNGRWNNGGYQGWTDTAGSYGDPPPPAYNPTHADIVILGDAGTGLSFTLLDSQNSWTRSVRAGGHYKCTDDREWYVEFHRGGEYGSTRYRLKPGTYRFGASDSGWELWKL